ncbi:Cupin domain protein [compost metagenome]
MELGPPTLDTFDRTVLSLGPNATWKLPRSTASRILVVVEGNGVSTIGDHTFSWAAGDVLAVPAWLPHRHTAATPSLLIAMSDEPLMRKLSWFRAEAA